MHLMSQRASKELGRETLSLKNPLVILYPAVSLHVLHPSLTLCQAWYQTDLVSDLLVF